jgi:hypothetical protein
MSLTKARATAGGRSSGSRIIEPDIVETLKAFREEFKELLHVIFVADRTGFCAEHQHRLLGNAVDGHLHSLLWATVYVEQVRKDQRFQFCGCL